MNPRVSRSSALASKATGFPIAKIAAKVAVGFTLDEITNDITGQTCAAFEPSLDYVVVKIPRWSFEKFPGVDTQLGPQMKSVGEVMALGATFSQALMKAVQSLEIGIDALDGSGPNKEEWMSAASTADETQMALAGRLFSAYRALRSDCSLEEVAQKSGFDAWFLAEIQGLVVMEKELRKFNLENVPVDLLKNAKRLGFGDAHLGRLFSRAGQARSMTQVRQVRIQKGITPVFQRVDTCAAEFESQTPYLYSTYEMEDEARPTCERKILILGGGPNRIGQGIEFDYCCCQAAYALEDMGYEVIMLNCNPETVSTDYDTSDRLYFEPMTLEHVLNVVEREKPLGVVVQLGGQTPLNLAAGLEAAGVPILGTSPASIRMAEDREEFAALLDQLGISRPEYGIAHSLEEAYQVAETIGYPVLVRPSFVLGGRAMAVVADESQLAGFVGKAFEAMPDQPLLVDRFMEDAYEIDVDAMGDGKEVVVGAVMQHIEEAGVHSGDSACILPPYKVSEYHLNTIREYTVQLGKALCVKGLLNVQYAIREDIVYVLEVNPRASRTVPFASKATGLSMARIAAQVMGGRSLAELGVIFEPRVDGFFVKEAVLPFRKLPCDISFLGPEMRSTGEVMGHASHFGHAFAKSQLAAGDSLPLEGSVLISVNDFDKGAAAKIARDLHRMGYQLFATPGTAEYFRKVNLPVSVVKKFSDGSPNLIDLIREKRVDMILNTPLGAQTHADGAHIRWEAVRQNIPLLTTLSAAVAAVEAIRALRQKEFHYRSLQDHYQSRK